MPRRDDLHKILIIGSGPIVIGQACEFDYSGTQACKALTEEGYEVALVNSNPATIMTDPEMADRTYVEPLTVPTIAAIIERERPDALLPTLGGQTGLNAALALSESGTLSRYNVELIGATRKAIKKAEDRELFKDVMAAAGLPMPDSATATDLREARKIIKRIGLPVVVRPSATLGGIGGGQINTPDEIEEAVLRGIDASPMNEVLIEQSVVGWKEIEYEVMRDTADNVVVICAIENFDPMGVHTGDSITVAPTQTLSQPEYQRLRDMSIKCIREVGVDTGGSNIQFAVHPDTGEVVLIEMNPRVSRSSALASKATGFPIAKIAAKLAVGYTLDELPNDITRETPASFEPTIDYVVTKIPRWTFEKFPGAEERLTTHMKSVGEAMAIGRTFKESLQKAIRSLEIGRFGLGADRAGGRYEDLSLRELLELIHVPHPDRLFELRAAFRRGASVDELYERTKIDPWFLRNLGEIVEMQDELAEWRSGKPQAQGIGAGDARSEGIEDMTRDEMMRYKRAGFSDRQIATLARVTEHDVHELRRELDVQPVVKLVDTCAAEFQAQTPYFYLTYEEEDEHRKSERKNIIILGGGPNRIGQGIEFDYCCVHAALALREQGYDAIIVNTNPETVSTDYDTSDKLYFEPLTLEDVLNICEKEKPHGVIVQFGGQTPLNLAEGLAQHGVPIIGTTPADIARAEDRESFKQALERLGLQMAQAGTATSTEAAIEAANEIGYPVVVRPSFVLGGRAMQICYDEEQLRRYMELAVEASPEHPVLVDRFLEDAIEIDVDAVCDGERCVIGGVMEHIEEAGVHSGDSACVLPPFSLSDEEVESLMDQTRRLAAELNVVGLLNIQYAIRNEQVYVLEANPRASRTVPYVSKAIGVPLAKIAARVMAGEKLEEIGFTEEVEINHFAVKYPVFPFSRFHGVDTILGPEMKSTGEVMGIDRNFGAAFAKAALAAGQSLPTRGRVFISVRNRDKRDAIFLAKHLETLGFDLVATEGTARALRRSGIKTEVVYRLGDSRGSNAIDLIENQRLDLIINTPSGPQPRDDERRIRASAAQHGVPCITTVVGASVAVLGVEALQRGELDLRTLQEYNADVHVPDEI
ncbi:MAG: carbamoyl-phosphate synthase large subunit [candidate division WS1 bacterium]|jgi:carbamoyl-phosphate synthase large subunit|nr:carbamoyl-phosphate synthase large subunit [candidate division WS1 bacterium]